MKKIISLVLSCVLLVGCLFAFTSCSGIVMGKYEAKSLVGTTTLEFELLDKVTVTYSLGSVNTTATGTYEIEKEDDGSYEIEFDFEDESVIELIFGDDDHSFVKGEENGESYIKIGLIKYTKVK